VIPGISRWELLSVLKPARYLGGELNQSRPKPDADLRVCLAYPDIYEIGMSNMALKILYSLLDADPRIAVERVFCPWVDFGDLLQRKRVPLFSLETKTPVANFDLLGITLSYEMTYTNVLYLLDLAGIPLRGADRTSGPFIVAGGPSASNPAPMADFFDAILVGDGEEAQTELCELMIRAKADHWSRPQTLQAIAALEGFYVPAFPKPVKRRVFRGFAVSAPPLRPLVPAVESIHDRVTLEIFRGCIQGCRFCNAGFFYRPKRERPVAALKQWAKDILLGSGDESLGLMSLSTSDYSCLHELISGIESEKVFTEQTLSVPSLRMNDKTLAMIKSSSSLRVNGLTFAPEAGSQRLRDIILKKITEADILDVIDAARDAAYRAVKLYFMIGLPFETDADVQAIVELVEKMVRHSRKTGVRKEFSVSLSGFVPKPHTPFQWARQLSPDEMRQRRMIASQGLRKLGIKASWRDEHLCELEGVLARGDQHIGKVLLSAYRLGAKFDGWTEHHKPSAWAAAFAEHGLTPAQFTREFPIQEILPWDFIDIRTPRAFFEKEYQAARQLAESGVGFNQE
jgi:radical SAM superfamily enzyme YgiQ (UPF0313 family)